MPEELENREKLDQSIAEQYAEEMARAEEMTRNKQKQKIAAKRKVATQFDEKSGQAPTMVGENELFSSLRKGDIGENYEDALATKKSEKDRQMPQEDAMSPREQRQGQAVAADREQTQAARENVSQSRAQDFRLKNLSPSKRRATMQVQREIKSTESEIARLKILSTVKRASGTKRALSRWGKAVLAGYTTIILGILLTIVSFLVVPLIIISGMVGLLPKSSKEREINSQIATLEKRLQEMRKRIAAS